MISVLLAITMNISCIQIGSIGLLAPALGDCYQIFSFYLSLLNRKEKKKKKRGTQFQQHCRQSAVFFTYLKSSLRFSLSHRRGWSKSWACNPSQWKSRAPSTQYSLFVCEIFNKRHTAQSHSA